ncbi:alpha-1,4-glucan--maltose-1-phosphate maltosyltransferase [Egicoccus sp. AB-alg6-2]|uniref:alpha-1,4-glucan--maltose-1-phosphate maltosyltransferase n=1 Tax=Egicoccus sp. AB-alg6-2 TaxID=3242692 RepID=UPI00359EBAB9
MGITNRRVSIRAVSPRVDGGRYPAKTSRGETVVVEADVFADSHDLIDAVVCWRRAGQRRWYEAPMVPLANDRWRGEFVIDALGRHEFRVVGWIDRFATWQRDTRKKLAAEVATDVDLAIGAELLREVRERASGEDADLLQVLAEQLLDTSAPADERATPALAPETSELVARSDARRFATESDRYPLRVDREKARYSTWYELFPRSASPEPGRHGTFDDVIGRLPYVAAMGFDVLYLPPIHPIGTIHRKGRNNAVEAEAGDPGSPWAIGSAEGGHDAIHPELGTIKDFRRLVKACGEHGLELALDIAFQCAPDHPWVHEHPEWFKKRPDGSIQYAENPPKKYQDIYPLDFETSDAEGLWTALKGVFEHWIDEGVRIFRVDNPHTKAFAFWEWCLAELLDEHPDLIFLSESFTRPAVMQELARIGFNQSYTYFAWKNHKWELEQYYHELFRTEVRDYFRPNSWPNTPDILTEFLQHGGRPAFVQKLVLAATLTANYGIYGPTFELMEHEARPGAEEYLDNEKYEIRHWDLDHPHSLAEMIRLVNRIRHDNPALQQDRGFALHHVDNEQLFAFSKRDPQSDNTVLVIVNLDTNWKQAGTTWLDLAALGIASEDEPFTVHDRIADARFTWRGRRNYVELDPHVSPAHVFVVQGMEA